VEEKHPVRIPAARGAAGPGTRLALLAFAQFIITLDYNIVFVALPDIGSHLGFTVQSLQWVVSAYVVSLGGFLLLGGRAADRLGARRMFITGLLIYAVSSLMGGLAQEPGLLLAARALQGFGGALLFPSTLRLIFTSFTEDGARNRAVAVYGAVGGAGLSAGALFGGLLTNYVGWRWIFFVNVPLALGAALLAPRILPGDTVRPGASKGFDLPGAITATLGATLLVLGLADGPNEGWSSPLSWGSIALGIVILGVFLVIESRSQSPLMPLRLLRHRSLAVTMAIAFLFQGGLATTYYLFTEYLQEVLKYSPLEAGLAFLPPTLASVLFATRFSTGLLNRLKLRGSLFAGVLVTGLGVAAITAGFSTSGSGGYWVLLPGLIIWACGGALGLPALFAGAAAGVSPLEQGMASAMSTTSRQIGGAVGLAALVAVANAGLDANSAAGHAATAALVNGFRIAGWVAAAATVAAAFLAMLIPRPPWQAASVPAQAEPDETRVSPS
jgi:EmrB/QacA subfamily drug resistance transporter